MQPAIPAAKNWLGDEALYWVFARWSLWSNFDRVWAQTVGPLPHPDQGPLILYLNHSSWWDGYMMMVIHRMILRRRFNGYLMMEENQLRAFRFFAWCGAFSINRNNRSDVVRAINYSSYVLRERRNRALYIFPQGKILPNDARPLVVYPGVARIIKAAGNVTLCPIALRYEFRGEQRPEAFIRLGPAHRPVADARTDAQMRDITERLTAGLDALRAAVVTDDTSGFQVLLQGRPGIDKTFARFLRLLRLV